MARIFCALVLASLTACSGLPQAQAVVSACGAGESSYACQVERYHHASE